MINGTLGVAVARYLPPESLARNTYEHGGDTKQNNSQEFTHTGPWVGGRTCLHILCHTDNEFLEFIVGQVLRTCYQWSSAVVGDVAYTSRVTEAPDGDDVSMNYGDTPIVSLKVGVSLRF